MTTYAPNFTPRFKLCYIAGGMQHTIQVRGPRGTDLAGMTAYGPILRSVFMVFVAAMYTDLLFTSAEVALTDDDVFIPVAVPTQPTGMAVDPADFSAMTRAQALTFTGKAPGSRARFSLYGVAIADEASGTTGGDGKVTSTENAGIATVAGIASGAFKAGSGANAAFPNVATYKVNDHLLKLIRKGTIS